MQTSTNEMDSGRHKASLFKRAGSAQLAILVRLLPVLTLSSIALIWGILGSIPVRVVGQAIMTQPRAKVVFQNRASGQVLKVYVKPGDRIQVGQRLATLDLPELRKQLATQTQKRQEYEAEDRAITASQNRRTRLQDRTLELQKVSIPQQIAANRKQVEANQLEQAAIQKQQKAYDQRIEQLNEFIKLTRARFEAGKKLIAQGAIAPFDVNFVNAENLLQQNENERTNLFAKLEDLAAKSEQLQASSVQLRGQNSDLIATLESINTDEAQVALEDLQADIQRQNAIDDLKRDIINLKTKIRTEQEIISTYEGEVMTVGVNPGQYIQAGTVVGTLKAERPESEEVVFGFFTPEDANRIQTGMRADVTPNLLTARRFGGTRERYGSIVSEVTWVSQQAVTVQEIASLAGNEGIAQTLTQNPIPYSIPDNGIAQDLPVIQVALNLETADTPSGYRWTQGQGPPQAFPDGSIGDVWVTVEERSLLDYAMAGFRWLTGIYSN